MLPLDLRLTATLATLFAMSASAAVRYVDVNSADPTPPFGDWPTAATTIQDAIDVAGPGDQIFVANGVYQTGGRSTTVFGRTLTNRVLIDKSVTVQSMNGPDVTIILGYIPPPSSNGVGAVRCAMLTNGASLVGFTLTNGSTWVSPVQNQGGGVYCASAGEVVSNCLISGNYAYTGGGAYGGTLRNCILSNNLATQAGGGAYSNTLLSCQLIGNSISSSGGAGGGASSCTAQGCFFSGNLAANGGGAALSTLNNCTLTANTATNSGGGVFSCNLSNCIIYYNFAPASTNFTNCTMNFCCTSPQPTGGYGNLALEPKLASLSHLSVDSPCRTAGNSAFATGTDIDGQPWLNPPSVGCDELISDSVTGLISLTIKASYENVASGFPIQFSSQVFGQASASYWDFGDGTIISNQPLATHAWSGPGSYPVLLTVFNDSFPSGVIASQVIAVISSPIHYVAKESSTPSAPYLSWATAATNIQDAVDAAFVGGTVLVSNGVYGIGGRLITGSTTNRVAVTKPIKLMSANGPRVTVITGNRHPLTTNGNNAIRGVYLANDTTLSGFMLTNGATSDSGNAALDQSGGGVWCQSHSAVVSNCLFIGNSANSGGGGCYSGSIYDCAFTNNSVMTAGGGGGGACLGTFDNCTFVQNSAYSGGGICGGSAGVAARCAFFGNSANYGGAASGAVLIHCVLSKNFAAAWGGATFLGSASDSLITLNHAGQRGGGAYDSVLWNCTVVSNSVVGSAPGDRGGGTYSGTLFNSLVFFNSAPEGPNSYPSISSIITNSPLFIDPTTGNYELQSGSPCINAGQNNYVTNSTDLAGNPRIVGGSVDVGAFEFQSPASVLSYAWLQQFGLPVDGSADFADPDEDGMNNWQEWHAGTSPIDAGSALRIISVENAFPGVRLRWQSAGNRNYWVERATDLGASSGFSVITTNTGGGIYTDSTATNSAPYFYRIEVRY
jgi:hypothetical protein